MFAALFLVTVTLSSFADSVQRAYAAQDAEAVRQLARQADTRTHRLLARYRLYPLTEDEQVIDAIPSDLEDGSARELALLSGLWAYRAGETSFFGAIRCGRRSMNLLEQAREKNPLEPYVLLVEGQSLLFRPSIAGRDAEKAVLRFRQLVGVLDEHPDTGISKTEAEAWLWLALREVGQAEEARDLHAELMAQGPPPLYRQFLEDPPQV